MTQPQDLTAWRHAMEVLSELSDYSSEEAHRQTATTLATATSVIAQEAPQAGAEWANAIMSTPNPIARKARFARLEDLAATLVIMRGLPASFRTDFLLTAFYQDEPAFLGELTSSWHPVAIFPPVDSTSAGSTMVLSNRAEPLQPDSPEELNVDTDAKPDTDQLPQLATASPGTNSESAERIIFLGPSNEDALISVLLTTKRPTSVDNATLGLIKSIAEELDGDRRRFTLWTTDTASERDFTELATQLGFTFPQASSVKWHEMTAWLRDHGETPIQHLAEDFAHYVTHLPVPAGADPTMQETGYHALLDQLTTSAAHTQEDCRAGITSYLAACADTWPLSEQIIALVRHGHSDTGPSKRRDADVAAAVFLLAEQAKTDADRKNATDTDRDLAYSLGKLRQQVLEFPGLLTGLEVNPETGAVTLEATTREALARRPKWRNVDLRYTDSLEAAADQLNAADAEPRENYPSVVYIGSDSREVAKLAARSLSSGGWKSERALVAVPNDHMAAALREAATAYGAAPDDNVTLLPKASAHLHRVAEVARAQGWEMRFPQPTVSDDFGEVIAKHVINTAGLGTVLDLGTAAIVRAQQLTRQIAAETRAAGTGQGIT